MNISRIRERLRQGVADACAPFYCDSGGGGGGTTTTTTQNFSPEEAAQRAKVQEEASRIYAQTAPSMTAAAYPGATPVGPSAETRAASQYATNYAMGPAVSQANNINNAVQFGLSDVLYPDSNPALRQTIDAAVRPITESYTDPTGVMANIRSGAQQTGQYGGSRQGIAEGVAAGKYADAVGDASSKVATEGYNKGLDTFSRTLAFAPQALNTGLMPSNILSGVGAQNEMYSADQANYDANAAMWELNSPWAPLQNYASIVYGGANPSTSSMQSGGSSSGSTMQTIGALGSIAAMFMSDSRLKENIVPVGQDAASGFNLYEYNYIDEPDARYRGVMADEVIQTRPDAVAQNAAGYLMVDYMAINVPFVRVN